MEFEHPFIHLHVHTEFSLLDGLSKIDKLVNRAKALNMTSLAITDHGTMHGVIPFYRACRDNNIKPIIGLESYQARKSRTIHDQSERQPYHLLLLAKNEIGYKNLLKLASEAQLTGFYVKPRVDKELLQKYHEGIICTSGCLAAQIPRTLEEGRESDAFRMIGEYQEIFGKDNFFLELQQHDIPQIRVLNEWLVRYRGKANVPLIATNDVHYVLDGDFNAHDTLLCIQTNALKKSDRRMKMSDASYHLRTPDEMWALFGDIAPEAISNTLLVADMCSQLDLEKKSYHLPPFPVPPEHDAVTFLRMLALRGARWRYGDQAETEMVQKRINYELSVINNMGFETYFLIVWDLCEFARKADIWWNVRGSGAGSVVAYCLGITSIDPLRNNLIFERFLNPGRSNMPDIDMDFPDDRRAEMIDYAKRKYGEDKVAAIVTFGTLKARAAIKDVGRALGFTMAEVTSLTKLVPNIPSKPVTLVQCLGDDPEYGVPDLRKFYDDDPAIHELLDTAMTVEGVARSAGTHAAGIIIGDKPLVEYLPLQRPTGNENSVAISRVTQFPMEICESIGLLKVDFLGLSTLTIMRKACELIERYHAKHYTLANIPYRPDPNDPELSRMVAQAFELIGTGEVTGVFQLESQGMRKMLVEMQPKTFEHITAAISLYRPGPLQFIPMFNSRLHGDEKIEYLHPKLEPILSETYAVICYQEQIQQIAAQLFGYSLGDADLMRRAVSKKKAKDLLKHKEIFIAKGPENGVPADVAEKIFDQVEYFAAYGFNKCLAYNTEIIDADSGRLVKIGDLATGKAHITHTITCDTDRLRLQVGEVTEVHVNGVKPVYRLTTNLGRTIDATANHPFYTFGGWKLLSDLKVDDKIAVPRRLPIQGNVEWPDHEVIVLGHLLADRKPSIEADHAIDTDIDWDAIVSIEYIGEQPTYDLTVPGTHNFIANDIIVHNSHAADYAVITCQTAFLKRHYAPEYYTALLTVQRDKIEDVTLFTSDCRRLGIPILPPDVNHSELDFTIEETERGRGIRFGLGAIKNAGDKSVQAMVDERLANGPYTTLVDFCERVDFRSFGGKRPLEAMIMVGAFDVFGDRDDLLAASDRIDKYSKSYHQDKEIGQVNMFGNGSAAVGVDSGGDILSSLPAYTPTTPRQKLRWEKELLGLYVSDHPLNALASSISHLPNLVYSNQLKDDADALHNRPVTIAGLVVGIRPMITKKSEMMAFVAVEDARGTIETVFFPRTWEKLRDVIIEDNVFIIRGKADTKRGGTPQVVVDSVYQDFDISTSADEPVYSNGQQSSTQNGHNQQSSSWEPPTNQNTTTEDEIIYYHGSTIPDQEPPDVPTRDIEPPPIDEDEPLYQPPARRSQSNGQSNGSNGATAHAPSQNGQNGSSRTVPANSARAAIIETDPNVPPPRHLIIYFQLTDNREVRMRFMTRIYRKLTECPGSDAFTFRVEETNGIHTLHHPQTICIDDVQDFLKHEFRANPDHWMISNVLPTTP